MTNAVSEAWTAIVNERGRQISDEGWSAAHDDQHTDGSLLSVAIFYLWAGSGKPGDVMGRASFGEDRAPVGWPWAAKWWKPKDRRSNLIRAGALCLAERDRCIRAGLTTGPADHKLGLVLRELADLASPPAPHEPLVKALREAEDALVKTEALDDRDDCPECEGQGEPEICPLCFPKADDARLARRAAIASLAALSLSEEGRG